MKLMFLGFFRAYIAVLSDFCLIELFLTFIYQTIIYSLTTAY